MIFRFRLHENAIVLTPQMESYKRIVIWLSIIFNVKSNTPLGQTLKKQENYKNREKYVLKNLPR